MKRSELAKVLEIVRPAVSDQPLVSVFGHFVFTNDTVYGFDDKLAIIGPCPLMPQFSVQGATLFGFIKNSRAKDVTFTLRDDDVLIKAGRSKMTLPGGAADEFIFEEPDDNWDVELKINDALIEGIKICLATSSQDYSLPALMGVSLIIDKTINLYSCDGDAVSRYVLGKTKKEKKGTYSLSNEFCNSFMKVSDKSGAKSGKIFVNENWAKAEFNNKYKVYGRTIENTEPLDYESLIKRTLSDKPEYIKIPKGLNNALLRARVVADAESQMTVLAIKENKLRLNTETAIGDVKDVLTLRENHPDIEVGVNSFLVQRSTLLCEHMAILDNCTCYKTGDTLFQILSNMDV